MHQPRRVRVLLTTVPLVLTLGGCPGARVAPAGVTSTSPAPTCKPRSIDANGEPAIVGEVPPQQLAPSLVRDPLEARYPRIVIEETFDHDGTFIVNTSYDAYPQPAARDDVIVVSQCFEGNCGGRRWAWVIQPDGRTETISGAERAHDVGRGRVLTEEVWFADEPLTRPTPPTEERARLSLRSIANAPFPCSDPGIAVLATGDPLPGNPELGVGRLDVARLDGANVFALVGYAGPGDARVRRTRIVGWRAGRTWPIVDDAWFGSDAALDPSHLIARDGVLAFVVRRAGRAEVWTAYGCALTRVLSTDDTVAGRPIRGLVGLPRIATGPTGALLVDVQFDTGERLRVRARGGR